MCTRELRNSHSTSRVLYGDVRLSLDDALYGHSLDSTIHYGACWSPMRGFDPADVARLMVQDAIAAGMGGLPDIWSGWYTDCRNKIDQPRWSGTDAEFIAFVTALRRAVLLPLCEPFLSALYDLLDAWAKPEAARRIHDLRRRARDRDKYGERDWRSADLVAEVSAVAGKGVQRGRAWWFVCPLHLDKRPSLEVDPAKRVFHCFGCGAAGGVIDWRRRIEAAA